MIFAAAIFGAFILGFALSWWLDRREIRRLVDRGSAMREEIMEATNREIRLRAGRPFDPEEELR